MMITINCNKIDDNLTELTYIKNDGEVTKCVVDFDELRKDLNKANRKDFVDVSIAESLTKIANEYLDK